jgi:superfamily II DNA or RNA helicase
VHFSNSISLRSITMALGYSSGDDDLLRDFYIPCLSSSNKYSRAAGYFRSTLYIAVGLAFSDFATRGGRIRLVCSPHLSPEDIGALDSGYEERVVVGRRSQDDIRQLLTDLKCRPVTEFLATLVAARVLDIRVAYKPNRVGIFHQKLGIFEDTQGNRVSFNGSANETFSAWDVESNSESFDVFRSWESGVAERVTRHSAYFERLWAGEVRGLRVVDFPDLAREELVAAKLPSGIDDAAERVRHLVGGEPPAQPIKIEEAPRRSIRVLQKHQREVIESWHASGNRGIVAHVTGSGKTVTALHVMREWCQSDGTVLVLVPSALLAKQWVKEIDKDLGDLNCAVLTAGAGSDRASWEPFLGDFTRPMRELGVRVTVATLQTASKQTFRARLQDGKHLLVVADEVHRAGSSGYANLLEIKNGATLGLSATPARFGDPEGTQRIFDYFGPILEPKFQIPDAIAAKRLVPYDYFVHQMRLTAHEQEAWDGLTAMIRRDYARLPKGVDGARVASDKFRLLLFRRAAILKQASEKVDLAANVLRENFKQDDRWLVYCDSQKQLEAIRARLLDNRLPAYEYHSSMEGDRDATLNHFSERGGIVVAIRCLDEGVDIPNVNRALILASSTNSREFIQRRGRVLRTHEDKFSAEVHDCVVLPAAPSHDVGDDVAILRTELRRCAEFAQHSRNRAVALELAVLARRHGLEEFDFVADEQEEQEDG